MDLIRHYSDHLLIMGIKAEAEYSHTETDHETYDGQVIKHMQMGHLTLFMPIPAKQELSGKIFSTASR
jgi:hypothetical protein